MLRWLRALLPCCMLALAPALMQCGGSVEPGTETGNPPQIVRQKLYLELGAGVVRVVGAAGAIAPAAAAVRVTNLATGQSILVSAAADGSLDVVIAGAAGDEYEVTVTSGGETLSERISFAEIASRSDLGGLSCDALEQTLGQNLSELFENGDRTCTSDADCTLMGWSVGAPCYTGCGVSLLSLPAAADATSRANETTQSVCRALEACDREPPPSCAGGPPYEFALCQEGRCEGSSCGLLLAAARSRRDSLEANADKSCSIDADCGVARRGVSCIPGCGSFASVSAAAVAALETAIDSEVEQGVCVDVAARRCDFEQVECSEYEPPRAFCDAGTCALDQNVK